MEEQYLNVIYLGERVGSEDTLVSIFQHCKKELAFKKASFHQIGTTYTLKKTSDGKFSFPRYGLGESTKQIAVSDSQIDEWAKEHDLAKDEVTMIRERKKIKNSSDWLKCLSPVAKEYSKASRKRKAAIELAVIHYLKNYFYKGD